MFNRVPGAEYLTQRKLHCLNLFMGTPFVLDGTPNPWHSPLTPQKQMLRGVNNIKVPIITRSMNRSSTTGGLQLEGAHTAFSTIVVCLGNKSIAVK